MTTRTINITLPDDVYRRLQQVADATRRPMEAVVIQSIQGNLPPSADDLSPDLRGELSALQDLSDAELWALAREALLGEQWRRHQRLLRKRETAALTAREQQELDQLRDRSDRAVLRRSYALALLKWRGYTLPALGTSF
ncbi:MAG: hypothetical protein IPO81_31295 [Kouleothrix sp.]|nr:hypothetical protein [Kouleothrix sp.]